MSTLLNRRNFIKLTGLAFAGSSMIGCTLRPTGHYEYELTIAPTPLEILPGTTTPALAFNGRYPAPTIRGKQGERLKVHVINRMDQPTTVHWHGIRIDNAMDGVPFLTQPPIMPGESFTYDFVCPDAGTFWYHPHVNSLQQLSRGLVGPLIVDEKVPQPFDHDQEIILKDWLLNDDGSFKPFTSPRQAFRMGTLGNVKTVNGKQKPVFEIPAGGLIRTRFFNMDNTRVFNLSLKGHPAQVLALDGIALREPYPLDAHATGAGMRMDIGLIAPEKPGEDVVIYDRKGRFHFEICRLRTVAANLPKRTLIPTLPAHDIVEPDLANAEIKYFSFEWEGAMSPSDADGNTNHKFWTINKRAWEGMSAGNIPEPLATLELGRTYIFDLHNATPHEHPIHLHGYSFTIIRSNKRDIKPYETDTILLASGERAQVAFVADNPGRWMYHCHVIEHMKTGLMGYISVV